MELLQFSPETVKIFFLILIRVSVVLFLFPVFGSNLFPLIAKAGFALLFSIVLFPVVGSTIQHFPQTISELLILMVAEAFVGLSLGLTVRMFFGAVQLAGQLISFQMGFAVINVIDPQTGSQVSILDQLGYWAVFLVFLLLNGHHILIGSLVDSFHILGIGSITLKSGLLKYYVNLAGEMFTLAVKIGAPGIVALLFVSTAFGLCAKFAPQMNILIAAFPVKIVVGLFFFGTTLEIIAVVTRGYMSQWRPMFHSVLKAMGS